MTADRPPYLSIVRTEGDPVTPRELRQEILSAETRDEVASTITTLRDLPEPARIPPYVLRVARLEDEPLVTYGGLNALRMTVSVATAFPDMLREESQLNRAGSLRLTAAYVNALAYTVQEIDNLQACPDDKLHRAIATVALGSLGLTPLAFAKGRRLPGPLRALGSRQMRPRQFRQLFNEYST